jgi:hypothetical protein
MLFNSWQDETYGSPTFMAIPTQQLCTFVDKQLYTFICVNSCMEQTIIRTLKNVLWCSVVPYVVAKSIEPCTLSQQFAMTSSIYTILNRD